MSRQSAGIIAVVLALFVLELILVWQFGDLHQLVPTWLT